MTLLWPKRLAPEKPSGGGGRVGFHVLSAPGASPSGGDLVMSLMEGEASRVFS